VSVTGPGTYRESDGSRVDFATAKQAWAEAARPALLRAASVYHGWISYGDLAEEVQTLSGIRTRALMHYWIGEVLGMVSHQCHARGEPLLSSLCVDASGSVGPGYGTLLSEFDGPSVSEDLDTHAASERFKCYRYFGAELPTDGGRPALTPKLKASRERARQRSRAVPDRSLCPRCHVMLPLSGQCDFCD
jgi:hypothetical protein